MRCRVCEDYVSDIEAVHGVCAECIDFEDIDVEFEREWAGSDDDN